jgi:HD-GYP domain-containing protein (c-di-GMP phosphodiesterase class II)
VTAKAADRSNSVRPINLPATSNRLQVPVANLKLGLFVAELDRPWVGTPFLLQGFLLDSVDDLETLREYCSFVYVNLKFSDAEVAAACLAGNWCLQDQKASAHDAYDDVKIVRDAPKLPTFESGAPMPAGFAKAGGGDPDEAKTTTLVGPTPIESRHNGTARSAQAINDPPISDEARLRFLELVRAIAIDEQQHGLALLDRISNWFKFQRSPGKTGGRRQKSTKTSGDLDMSSILPPDVSLTIYPDTTAVEAELPRAKQALAYSKTVTRDLVQTIETGGVPDIPGVKACVDNIVDSMIANPDAMMFIAKLRDEDIDTYHHGVKVSLYLIALGRHLGIPKAQLTELGLIGMLADVGKTRLPRALLAKPGILTPAEFGVVKGHVELGLESLKSAAGLTAAVLQGIAQHHERLDGSGYPNRLKGDQIGVYGRMTAIADSFSAMIAQRPYASAASVQDALISLFERSGTSFSAPLVEQFVQAIGVFPVGSLVELSNGEVAVVVAHNRVRRLEPRVLVLTWPNKTPLGIPIERDLFEMGKSSRNRLRIRKGVSMDELGVKIYEHFNLDETAIDQIST